VPVHLVQQLLDATALLVVRHGWLVGPARPGVAVAVDDHRRSPRETRHEPAILFAWQWLSTIIADHPPT